jgi:hypothetical protein
MFYIACRFLQFNFNLILFLAVDLMDRTIHKTSNFAHVKSPSFSPNFSPPSNDLKPEKCIKHHPRTTTSSSFSEYSLFNQLCFNILNISAYNTQIFTFSLSTINKWQRVWDKSISCRLKVQPKKGVCSFSSWKWRFILLSNQKSLFCLV